MCMSVGYKKHSVKENADESIVESKSFGHGELRKSNTPVNLDRG